MGKREKSLLKNGIWVQEQNGVLTMGPLDDDNHTVVELSPELTKTILNFEKDMVEALYGEDAVPFVPGVIHVKRLLIRTLDAFDLSDVRVSISCDESLAFRGEYDIYSSLITGFVKNSLEQGLKDSPSSSIFINVSILDNNLCMIYRDSGAGSRENGLEKEFALIREKLKGEVTRKYTTGRGSYIDMMIPVTPYA